MATLLLSTVGTAIGGPLGGALGALVGQQIDDAIVGGGTSEGPRISDLAVTTSTYGQPIPRLFGTMRVPGSIIWSTDLQETSETNGNGKGKPKTTHYSYTMSFAVALSSRPISGIKRIWADGNLLRGASGDLKVGGQIRVHTGFGNQAPDPLLASALGANCPGFRGISYVVFEDLQLAEFGNRIPALTFEVLSDSDNELSLEALVPFTSGTLDYLPNIQGFADHGGSLRSTLNAIDKLQPLSCVTASTGLTLSRLKGIISNPILLPSPLKDHNQSEGRIGGDRERIRLASTNPEPRALRYFDVDRDYQASVQRSIGVANAGREVMLELPAAIDAIGARELCNQQTLRSRWQQDRISWKIAELDPNLAPGSVVNIPGQAGHWLIKSWEWMERGVELALQRMPPEIIPDIVASSGDFNVPSDELPSSTSLLAFELPWDGLGSSNDPLFFAAASGTGVNWSGAALYIEQGNALVPLNNGALRESVIGELTTDLEPSCSMHFEAEASIEISFVNEEAQLNTTTIAGLSAGNNRILIGDEIVQFLSAEPVDANTWSLSGLLRGRGGTEHAAAKLHAANTKAVLLNDALELLDSNLVPASGTTQIAAIGLGDEEPVYANLAVTGVSRNPLSPVHTRVAIEADGSWNICWTRRARGQWTWPDGIETPLLEEGEAYLVGCGPVDDPSSIWRTSKPELTLNQSQIATLMASHAGERLWVRQIGTFGISPPTHITTIS